MSSTARLEALQDFASFASRSIPLSWFLDGVPLRLSQIFAAPVVSLYLAEGDNRTLVMRGNVGFGLAALGRVRLEIGEGLTGLSVAARAPVLLSDAPAHEGYRSFPELDEERYPVFLSVPLVADEQAVGALVLQRERGRFRQADVELLVALSSVVASMVRHADFYEDLRSRFSGGRRAGGGTRRVVLPGRPVVPGKALGPLTAVRRPPRRALTSAVERPVDKLIKSFESSRRRLRSLRARAEELRLGEEASFLETYVQILADARFESCAVQAVAHGASIHSAMGRVAQDAVRAATRLTRDAFLEQRARDIEDLSNAIAMQAVLDPRAAMPSRTLLMAEALTVYDLLVTARSKPVGVALTERAGGPRTRVLLELLSLPSILDVGGMFRWASDGDIALLDATHGLLLINPTRAEVVEVREAQNRATASC